MIRPYFLSAAMTLGVATLACSSAKDTGTGSVSGATTGDGQTPPTGQAAIDPWLAQGSYKSWTCEPAPHDARSPSPHGTNRICSNDLVSKHGDGAFPIGAAAVKELYDGEKIIGHAVYRKVAQGGGESWYWYENANGTVAADGTGASGTPKDVCASCHGTAGTNGHSGHDFVFTQVS